MVRKTTLTVLMVLGLLTGMIVLSKTASAISLKQNTTVSGDTITLGDVFQGLSSNEDKVLGLAPQPGKEMVLNARTLLRIAVALDLPWRPANSADHIVVKRSANIVDRAMIESAVRAEIEKQGIDGKYNLVIPENTAKIILAPDVDPTVEITDFKMNPATGWFEASTSSPSAANAVHTGKITGSVQKLVDMPVLRKTLNVGDVINDRDLDLIEMKESDIRPDMVMNIEDIIGQTPRRLTVAGKPLKTLDLEAPEIVSRGDIVTMTFEVSGMTLTASGKAMQNGAKGDLIRVLNTNSNKTIEGFVTASKEVTVKSF